MKQSALTRSAAAIAAVAAVVAACGSDTETKPSASSTTAPTSTSSAEAAPSTNRVAPRREAPDGPAPTIADYIAANDIEETPVHRGDPGAPMINLPFPEGWKDAGADAPEWAYGAIIYPDAQDYTPSIVALVSKLVGDVDPQAVLEHAPGELTNLAGWKPLSRGKMSTLGEFPAYQLGGTWVSDGVTKIIAQKTVVIPGSDGLYVLQLNADGLESQMEIVASATDVIDDETTITP